jgi:hypothetical protein
MTRMGHDSGRAALIYQHEARGTEQRITSAIDGHVQAERARYHSGGDDDGTRNRPRNDQGPGSGLTP